MNFDQDIEPALEVLRKGGIILYPTDTIWGLGCDATNPEAVDKIFRIKQRPAIKSLIVLLADERDLIDMLQILIPLFSTSRISYIADYRNL